MGKFNIFKKKKRWNILTVTLITLVFLGNMIPFVEFSKGSGGGLEHKDEWVHNSDENFNSVAISADGKYTVAGHSDIYNNKNVLLFKNNEGKEPIKTGKMDDSVTAVAISKDGHFIAAGNNKGHVKIFNRDDIKFTPWRTYRIPNAKIHSLSISDDGEFTVVGADTGIYLINRHDTLLKLKYSTDFPVRSVSMSGNGVYFAAGDTSGKVYLFKTGKLEPNWKDSTGAYIRSVSISNNGGRIIAGNGIGNVYLYEKESKDPLWIYEGDQFICSVSMSGNGIYSVAGSIDSNVYLFDNSFSTPIWNYSDSTVKAFRSVSISKGGHYFSCVGEGSGTNNKLYLFWKDNSTPIWTESVCGSTKNTHVSISDDGGQVVVAGKKQVFYYKDTYEFTDGSNIDEDNDGEYNVLPIVYCILHDPSGDGSYTYFSETNSVTFELSSYLNVGLYTKWETSDDLWGDFSGEATVTWSTSGVVSVAYSVTDSFQSEGSDDKSYLGPGYGDRYLIEDWHLRYRLFKRTLKINTNKKIIETPVLQYGFFGGTARWLSEEGVKKDYGPIKENWILGWNMGRDNFISPIERPFVKPVAGYFPKNFDSGDSPITHEETMTHFRSYSQGISMSISAEAAQILGYEVINTSDDRAYIGAIFEWGRKTRFDVTQQETASIKLVDTNYITGSKDDITTYVWRDCLFGTLLATTVEDESETYLPHEYWTQKVDTDPPTASILDISNGSKIKDTFQLRLEGIDNDKYQKFQVFVNGIERFYTTNYIEEDTKVWAWDTVNWEWSEEGIHHLLGIVSDTSGNMGYDRKWVIEDNSAGNDPPDKPYEPSPIDGSANIGINPDLSWSCNDPGDTISYDVYFEANDPTPDVKVSSNQSGTTYDPGTLDEYATYYWRIIAWDSQNNMNQSEIWHFTTTTPPVVSGPIPVNKSSFVSVVDIEELNVSIVDPDDDSFDWSIDTVPDIGSITVYDDSDDGRKTCDIDNLDRNTSYTWYVNTTDDESHWTREYYNFTTAPNQPPNPPTISGPSGGKPGDGCTFYVTTDDPEGDEVYYLFEWCDWKGDGQGSDWIGPYESGETVPEFGITHAWNEKGKYIVKVKAKDTSGYESEWNLSDSLPISFSYNLFLTGNYGMSNSGKKVFVVGQNIYSCGQAKDGSSPYDFTWDYGAGRGATNFTQNSSYVYTDINESENYTITFNITDNDNDTFNVSEVIQVVILRSNFSMNPEGWWAEPNEQVYFNDTSMGYYDIVNWTWAFDDGNISYDQNVSHVFAVDGVYNVSLTVVDNMSNTNTSCKVVRIDSIPEICSVYNDITIVPYGTNVTIRANVTDVPVYNESVSDIVKVNIEYPNNTSYNFTMTSDDNTTYEYVFSDTLFEGRFNYTIWVDDMQAVYLNSSSGYSFNVSHILGYTNIGNLSQNVSNRISGSVFTAEEYGYAENITAYVYVPSNVSGNKSKCMIYRENDSTLIGTTVELAFDTVSGGEWITFDFNGSNPLLVKDTEYVLVCWGENTSLYYDSTGSMQGRYDNETYGNPPDPANFTNESKLYSIYCSYTPNQLPNITNVTSSSSMVGFGSNVTISADINDDSSGIDAVYLNIYHPDDSFSNFTMNNTGNTTYEYVFSDTWNAGQYDYSIWAVDNYGGSSTSSGHNFNVSANATISICTIKDLFENNETINITDPPGSQPSIGYEMLDDGKVLNIWNKYNSYYFNTSSGIQLTNHYNEYWSRNVLMLGYYNNNQWNLIYRTDELSSFNKNIDSDDETFVNATLWKDLNYGGYDFRLAIRYHLGVDDDDLTVIPYIKNLGDAIPYTLAFGWEIKDIKIANTFMNDSIRLFNGTDWISYNLNQTLSTSYDDMDYNTTFYLEGHNESEFFRRTLYLKWDHSLDYLLRVKSREGQYNAPVTLFIRIGTLAADQEKYIELNWLDSDDWLGVDGDNYLSCCGYDGPLSPSGALDGNDIWAHLCNENHWVIIDLDGTYNIKKIRGRSNTFNDPTSVDIYISDDPDNWGTAVYSGITTWQDTTSWAEVDITDTIGRYINISITSTESGAGTNYLEFGGIPTPMTIFDVYGESVKTAKYYFNNLTSSSQENAWATNPSYMVDGNTSTYASTTLDRDVEECTGNSCPGTDIGPISKVELRAYGYYATNQRDIILRPVFGGTVDGSDYHYDATTAPGWSSWFDITDDNNAPESWSWSDVADLDCDVEAELGMFPFTLYCSKVEIRVIYSSVPGVSNPVPASGSIGVSLTPVLNITVSDPEGDNLNITWLSNSSGSWQVFGTNTSVSNGTYHQTFSNATVNGQWWYWKVNVSDGSSFTESSVYKFYTGYESKIENTGSTSIKGYLLVQVQYLNITNMSISWDVVNDTINETSPRTINSSEQFGLDTVFNGNVNTTYLINNFGTGTYRIYAAFCDPDGDVLVCDDQSLMEDSYQFTVSTS